VFETTLDCVRSNKLEASQDLLKVMLRSADVLADLTAASRDGGTVESSRTSGLVAELEAYAKGQPLPGASAAPATAPAAAAPEPAQAETPAPAAEAPEPTDDSGFQPVPFSFDALDGDDELAIEDGRSVFTVRFKPRSDLYAKGNESVLILRELAKLGDLQVRCETDDLPSIDMLDPEGAYFSWLIRVETDQDEEAVRHVFEFVEWDSTVEITAGADEEAFAALDAQGEDQPMAAIPFDLSLLEDAPAVSAEAAAPEAAAPAAPAAGEAPQAAPNLPLANKAIAAEAEKKETVVPAVPAAPQTIRVDLDRVDRLINLVGELVINQAMLAQSVVENESGGSSAVNLGLEELQQLTREIQDSVMAIRAQPVKPVFQRMGRIVREIADMTAKQVRLVTEGENTEVDKTVIDKIAEPLTHMIRNAVDHGLETPEKRTEAGKSAEGVLRLSAKHRSGRIVIEIADDGAGINRERVKAKAIENGLITPETNLSDEDIDNLIFHPGFSTADKISDISGRGVGMDVVKRSIQALGGRISITSKPGKGSVFTMSLPLTLAVLDGMVVTVANQTLVVPLTAIVETLQPEKADIHSFGSSQRLIAIRDTFCPLVDVGNILNFRADLANPVEGVALLVESEGGGQRALMVDAIQGQRQVVIKSLEANYTNVPGIAAATILGDGRVALILDVDAVVTASRGQPLSSDMALAATG
jgi:two-component system chemotaxis sensor kinase CheA